MQNQQDAHAGQGTQFGNGQHAKGGGRNGESDQIADFRRDAADKSKRMLQSGVEAATKQTREASERIADAIGMSGADAERLADQGKRNMEAIMQCGMVLGSAFQNAGHQFMGIGQKQWQRNLDGVNKLVAAKSLHEFTTIQGDLWREGIQNMVQESHAVAEASASAIDKAGQTFKLGEVDRASTN